MSKAGHEDDELGEVFLDESDIIHEVDVDEEGFASSIYFLSNISLFISFIIVICACVNSDLPDADDDDAGITEEPDDSIHIFTGHTGKLFLFFSIISSFLDVGVWQNLLV